MWTRFLPHMVRIRDIIASGTLGEIRTLVAEHTLDLPDDPKHRLNDPALGGGALLDLGIYPVSFAHDVLGVPRRIHAEARFKPTGVDAQVSAILTHANDAVSLRPLRSDTGGQNGARILGTEARIEIDGVFCMPTSFSVYGAKGVLLERFEGPVEGRGMHYQAAELERLAHAGATAGTLMAPRDTVAVMQTLDTIRAQIGLTYPDE